MPIVVFPMLCSNSLNPNILPGVGKVVERYLIVHELDRVLERMNRPARVSKGRITIKEDNQNINVNNEQFISLNEIDVEPGNKPPGDDIGGGGFGDKEEKLRSEIEKNKEQAEYYRQQIENLKQKMDRADQEEKEKIRSEIDRIQKEKEKAESQSEYYKQQMEKLKQEQKDKKEKEKNLEGAVTGISMHTDVASIEPTWMEYDKIIKGEKVKDILGVKVVPFVVNSTEDYELANMMLYDKNLKKIESQVIGFGRSIKKKMYDLYKSAVESIPLVGGRGTITGNIRHDVIMAKTSFKGNIFLCVNEMEFSDDFFQEAGGIKKLFNLGWPSIIAVDDTSRSATFCMQTFKGMCYKVPYSYMYNLLGRGESKYYEDLNSVKKSSAGLFRKKVSPKRAFGESIAHKALTDHKAYIVENKGNYTKDYYLEEGISQILTEGKLRDAWNYVGRIKDLGKMVKSGNIKKLGANFRGRGDLKKIKEYGKKVNPRFDECYNVAKKKIDKFAPGVNDKLRQSYAASIAMASGKEPDRPTKYADQLADGSIKAINRWYSNIEGSENLTGKRSDYLLGAFIFSVIVIVTLAFAGVIIYGIIRGAMMLWGGADTPSGSTGATPDVPSGQMDTPGPGFGMVYINPIATFVALAQNPESTEVAKQAKQATEQSGTGILDMIHGVWNLVGGILMLAWNVGAAVINVAATILGSLGSLAYHLFTVEGLKDLLWDDPAAIFKIFRFRDVVPTFSATDIF